MIDISVYSRDRPEQSRAIDKVYELISKYPDGITYFDLMKGHEAELKAPHVVIGAIRTLINEGKVLTDQPWEGKDFLGKVLLRPSKP